MRIAALLVGFLPVCAQAQNPSIGRIRAFAPSALKGFRLYESGPLRLEASKTPGNVRRTFYVRFKNETREEIAEVGVRLRIDIGGTAVYRSPVFRIRRFNNQTLPHLGSILPFTKTSGQETFTVDYPGRFWTTASADRVEIVSVKAFVGKQNLRDTGHLFTWMANTPDAKIIERLRLEPRLVRVHDALGVDTTLIAFAASGSTVAKHVLEHGGNPKARTIGGSTIAHIAAFHTSPANLDLVRSIGISVDSPSATGRTPLFKSIQSGNALAWDWLLKHGANPNRVDTEGLDLVQYAIVEGQPNAFSALLRAGANRRHHAKNGWGWMHSAAVQNYLMLPYVLSTGVSVNDVDPRFKLTPLMVAARYSAIESVTWLAAHGARPGLKDAKGLTAYDYARMGNTLRTDRFFRAALARASGSR